MSNPVAEPLSDDMQKQRRTTPYTRAELVALEQDHGPHAESMLDLYAIFATVEALNAARAERDAARSDIPALLEEVEARYTEDEMEEAMEAVRDGSDSGSRVNFGKTIAQIRAARKAGA